MKLYSKSDIGLVRTVNQDAFDGGSFSDGACWAVVCDGMGGVRGGDIASVAAVKSVAQHIGLSYHENMADNSVKNMLVSTVYTANATVHEMAVEDKELIGMGTTMVLAVVTGGSAHIAHVGDSRAYLITAESAIQLTEDHSVVQELLHRGEINETEARVHPHKNVITRAVGVDATIESDYTECPLPQGDMLLLCTDGLTNYLTPEKILAFSKEVEMEFLPDRLVTEAKLLGGSDNITVIVIGQ